MIDVADVRLMSLTFATPPVGGFNRRGAHPDGGHFYGGAETELCELVRGGKTWSSVRLCTGTMR